MNHAAHLELSRVKRETSQQSRANPCNAGSETAEQVANMGQLSAGYTAVYPRGVLSC